MIKLTSLDVAEGVPIYVPVERIELIETDIHNGLTVVVCGRSRKHVEESPEEVARKVLEYRLAMVNFNHDSVAPQAEQKLYELSGISAEKGGNEG